MGEVIRINFRGELNAKEWLYNRSSRLFFLSGNTPDVPENLQATLVVDPSFERNSIHCERRFQRHRYRIKPLTEICLGTVYTKGEYTGYGDVEFDPSTNEYQIDAEEWKGKKDGIDFLCILEIIVDAVSRVNYHKDKFFTAPNVSKDTLYRLFEKTEELESHINKAREAEEPLITLIEKYPQLFP